MEQLSLSPSNSIPKLSHKIISIAAGEAHTLALSGDGGVHSWGRGPFGRLGTGSEQDQLFPIRVKFDSEDDDKKINIVGVAAGAYHSLALSEQSTFEMQESLESMMRMTSNITRHNVLLGEVSLRLGDVKMMDQFGAGVIIPMDGQLGADEENSSIPRIFKGFSDLVSDTSTVDSETESKKPLKVASVKAGGMMSLAIDDIGGLWIWGNCPHPELSKSEEGEFSLVSSSVPIPIWNFHGHTVVKVACGNEHVVALVSAGETHAGGDLLCYSWGGNNHGQLGLGDKESRSSPEVIEMFNLESPLEVYEVSCGAFHTALLTHRKRPSDTLKSVCWTFGLGDNGQLGHGITKSYLSPEPVVGLPESIFLISVACGLFHTCAVSSAGDVWSWGMEKGLGLCPDSSFNRADSGDAVSPLHIPCPGPYGPRFPEPSLVACGAAHTVLVVEAGYKLFSWGRGRSGVLGNGKQVDCVTPTIAMWPPLIEDFREIEPESSGLDEKTEQKSSKEIQEMEKTISIAMEEMKLLRSKYSVMEKYASILHGSIFGRPFQEQDIPASLHSSGTFDIAKEWENMLESSDRTKVHRLEMFYRTMISGIKDKLMKKRIQEIVKECLNSEASNK